MHDDSTGALANPAVLDDENLSESFPGPCAPITRDVILRIYPPLARTLARSAGLPEPASPVVFHEGRAFYSVSSLSNLLRIGPSVARKLLLPTVSFRPALRSLWPLIRDLTSTLRKVEDREIEFIRELDSFLKNERDRFETVREWNELRDSLLPFIDETRRRFEPTLQIDILALFLDDFYRWLGRTPQVRSDPLTASCLRSMRHLRNTINQDSSARDYLLSCAGTGHYSPAMLRLRNDDIAHLLNDFLDEFGDRCPGELKLETRSYREYPELFLPVLLGGNEPKKASPENQSTRGWIPNWLERKFASLLSFRQSSRWMRARAFGVLRERLLKMGSLLEETGAVESREDVFFFHLEELVRMESAEGKHRDLVMDRRVIHFDQGEITVAGRLRADGRGNWAPESDTGTPAVLGLNSVTQPMEGEVLLVPREDLIQETPESIRGKILVMHAAGPGLVHLLPWVGGLISETGSALSHASILCREFGIPVIYGAKGALEKLRSGQRVRCSPGSRIIQPIG